LLPGESCLTSTREVCRYSYSPSKFAHMLPTIKSPFIEEISPILRRLGRDTCILLILLRLCPLVDYLFFKSLFGRLLGVPIIPSIQHRHSFIQYPPLYFTSTPYAPYSSLGPYTLPSASPPQLFPSITSVNTSCPHRQTTMSLGLPSDLPDFPSSRKLLVQLKDAKFW
jgi:hypothetical protein